MGEYMKLIFVAPDRLPGGQAWTQMCDGLTNHTSEAWKESGCEISAGSGLVQVLFLLCVYGYVLYFASNLISHGSELLLLVPSMRNMVGSVVLPILGAVPDGAIVLFSGLGQNAQEEVAVGVGALAGSTIMLLTVPWALSIFAGRVDIIDGQAQYKRPHRTPDGKWSKVSGNCNTWFGTGVEPKSLIRKSAIIMIATAVTYLLIQIPAFYSPAHGIKAKEDEEVTKRAAELQMYWALAGCIVCVVCFIAYLVYQIRIAQTDEAVSDKIEAQQAMAIKNGVMTVSSVFYDDLKESMKTQANSQTNLLGPHATDAQKRMVDVLRVFFKRYDVNKDNHIDSGELQSLLADLGEKLNKPEMKALLDRIDRDNSGHVCFDEFVEGLPSFLLERVEHRLPLGGVQISQEETPEEVEEEEDEEIPEDLATMEPAMMIKAVTKRAFWQMGLGTLLVLVFSDPMVDVLNDVGRRIHVPAFYISFILAPLASNASELLASFTYAAKKTRKTISISMSTLLGAAIMNNTFCLGIFLLLIYARKMAWQFSAETIAILFVEICMFGVAMMRQEKVFHGAVVLTLLPLSLAMVALLEMWGLD